MSLGQPKTIVSTIRIESWLSLSIGALCWLILGLMASGLLPLLRFPSEEITIALSPLAFRVDATYHYENPLPIHWTQGLAIPIAEGPHQGAPYAIEAWTEGPGLEQAALPIKRVMGTYHADLSVPARSSLTLRLRYRQRAELNQGVYLLRTTRAWRRPLREARYTLETPCARLLESSIPLEGASTRLLDFMPDRDWSFSWEPAPCSS